ncbi:MAG TPA: class I SAM-dependent methyltransferase, partial [Nitrososphaerales archaeon]|nr:class I SAM-dependent methyltransferase [Nitrososphaerales archaeon]
MDIDPVMLSYLKANLESSNSEKDLSKVNIIEADVCNTSIPDQSVDLIIFANILHDLEDRRSFFKELKRISRKTARVIDIDWHKRN